MNEPTTTLVGNLVADPELRYTPNGAAVCNFTIAQTPKVKQNNEWVDGEALFARCSAWREMAENISESLTKGTRVIAQVRIRARSYETKEGDKRTVTEYEIDAIGPDLRFTTAKVNRAQRSGGGGGNNQRTYDAANGQGGWGGQQADPWAGQQGGFSGAAETPPF